MTVTWFEPTSVEARYFVNRTELRAQLLGVLEERLARSGTYTIGVTGLRGVGKSIFSRWCLDAFAKAHRGRVVGVHVDLRMVGLTEFLREFVHRLSVATRAELDIAKVATDDVRTLRRWLDELQLLARSETVTESELSAVTRQHSVTAGFKTGLVDVLEVNNSFTWQQATTATQGTTRLFRVTADLLHRGLREVLEHITMWTPLLVVVLFDDLDQMRADDLKLAVRNVLDITHCVRLVHLRREALLDDIVREMDLSLEVPPLDCKALWEMIDKRLESAPAFDRSLYAREAVRDAVNALCSATGSPLVLLRWLTTFALENAFTDGEMTRWHAHDRLERVVRSATNNAARPALLKSIAASLDSVTEVEPGVFDAEGIEKMLRDKDRKEATRLGLLGRVDQNDADADYWVHGALALLRPTVAKALRGEA